MRREPEPPRDPSGAGQAAAGAEAAPGRRVIPPPTEAVALTTGLPLTRRRSIGEIRAVNREARTTGHELIVPEEAKERNLQNAFVEVLASAGIPFETAFEIADVA